MKRKRVVRFAEDSEPQAKKIRMSKSNETFASLCLQESKVQQEKSDLEHAALSEFEGFYEEYGKKVLGKDWEQSLKQLKDNAYNREFIRENHADLLYSSPVWRLFYFVSDQVCDWVKSMDPPIDREKLFELFEKKDAFQRKYAFLSRSHERAL